MLPVPGSAERQRNPCCQYPSVRGPVESTPPGKRYIDREGRLHCPAVSKPAEPVFGYAMSRAAAGILRNDDHRAEELVFDSTDVSRNAAGFIDLKPKPGRHRGRINKTEEFRPGNVIGLVGGTVKFTADEK